jgi:hypothetical protein
MLDFWRPAAALVCAATVAGGAAEMARAGTATGRPAQFTAANGERNALTVDRTDTGEVLFTDLGTPIFSGLFCVPLPIGEATCDPDGDVRDTDGGGVGADLGDGDDRAVVRGVPGAGGHPGQVKVVGGDGKDYLENVAAGFIRFEGGAGDDTLVAGPGASGVLVGGTGADISTAGTLCCATSYEDHEGGVRVTLDGKPNDGGANEQDDVQTRAVIGGPGPDFITGDSSANMLTGSGGADILDGVGGNDTIDATVAHGPADARDTVSCGAGRDEVIAEANDDVAVDCEEIRVGAASGPPLVLDHAIARARGNGSLTLTYRGAVANPAATGTVRLVDRNGRSASSTVPFTIGAGQVLTRVKVTLTRATRRRLARSRSGTLALVAQRVYREADAALGYARFNARVTIRRAR